MKNDKLKLMKYSVAAASGLACGGVASGAIIHTPDVNLTLTFQLTDELYIDFEGQSASIAATPPADSDIYIMGYSSDDFSMYRRFSPNAVARNGADLLEFSAGQEIESGADFGTYGDLLDNSSFDTSMGQYAGVRLDDTNYGWVQLSFDSVNNTVTVYDFAYDNSGAPIDAGAIPEPGTMAFMALAGTAALAIRRTFLI